MVSDVTYGGKTVLNTHHVTCSFTKGMLFIFCYSQNLGNYPLYYILENSGLTTCIKRKTKQQWEALWYLLSKVFCFSGRFLWLCYDKYPCSCLSFFSPNSSWLWNIFSVSCTLLYLYSFWQFLLFIMQHVFSNCCDFWLPCGMQKSSS